VKQGNAQSYVFFYIFKHIATLGFSTGV